MTDIQAARLSRLLTEQAGMLSLGQAAEHGISTSAASRHVAAGRWRRVLPRVYATFSLELTEAQRVWAAVLYAGDGSAVTGLTALRQHRVRRLPDDPATTVYVAAAPGRQTSSREFVVVQRSARTAASYLVDGVRTMPLARATVDAAARASSYDSCLELLTAVIHSGKTSLASITDELEQAPHGGTRWLRLALAEAAMGSRSVAEALARQIFTDGGLPAPLVNEPIEVDGQLFEPDFRWGRVIVEIDSKEWHLLHPGSWEATLQRRALLQAGGYHVIPVSPSLLTDSPALVLTIVSAALVEFLGWSA